MQSISESDVIETSVLIVGGGPVGMGLSLELARLGVETVVVERNATTTTHPKSRGCTTRTMEDFRDWGIEDRVRSGGMGDGPDVVWVCESITGRVYGTTQSSPRNMHSPSWKSLVAQDVVEEAIADALAEQPAATLLRSTEFERFESDESGVSGWFRQAGAQHASEVRAEYLVACDGAGSGVRRSLGIEMVGPSVLATMVNYYYWADTSQLVPATLGNVIYNVYSTDHSLPIGRIAPSGPDNERWIFIDMLAEGGQPYSEDELVAIVRAHWGVPDLEVRLINTLTWRMSAQLPETFRRDRVLLAGDAAHRFPPAGGMGLNSGIQDARNLAWKLAMVLRHGASDRLLDTYESERRLIAESNNEWSTGNASRLSRVTDVFQNRVDDVGAVREILLDMSNHLNSEGQGFGKHYEHGAILPDGSQAPPHDPRVYWPSDRPGARFPHVWLDSSHETSSLDWFGNGFVMVCGPSAQRWMEITVEAGRRTGVPLVVRTLPSSSGPFTFTPDGAALVRPDGVVAWRPTEADCDVDSLLGAIDQILAGGTLCTTATQ